MANIKIGRIYRPRQKGVECIVPGCTEWCVSLDMCSKHYLALYRYGSVHGKPEMAVVCACGCGEELKTKRGAKYYRRSCYDKARNKKRL